jgi:hypothetical protein
MDWNTQVKTKSDVSVKLFYLDPSSGCIGLEYVLLLEAIPHGAVLITFSSCYQCCGSGSARIRIIFVTWVRIRIRIK